LTGPQGRDSIGPLRPRQAGLLPGPQTGDGRERGAHSGVQASDAGADHVIPASLSPEETRQAAVHAAWTFPSVLASAFVVAWGAEAAQFYISQGLALALLAWLQTLPEFAVEAAIAWQQDVPLMTANFTGALRLLTGVGWPMIWVVFAVTRWQRGGRGRWPSIQLDHEHSAEIVGLIPPLIYFIWIIVKGTLGLGDAAVLVALYLGYLALLNRLPPKEQEEVEDVARVARAVIRMPPAGRWLSIAGLFLLGGTALYFVATPFLESMKGLALALGVAPFVFVQWVAPFLSEFPEKTSAFYWARSRGKAGMALMNMVSSNINQWTVLAAMIPIVYSLSLGHPAAVPLQEHRVELILTLLQSMLGMVILANLRFEWYEAAGLFALWFAQFLKPDWREEMCVVYAVWLAVEVVSAIWRPGRLHAFAVFPTLWRRPERKAP
jgi:cation:H+ antiporter